MRSAAVVAFCRRLRALGIEIWLDGGWGVDALLGEQTRPHEDLDIVVEQGSTNRPMAPIPHQPSPAAARSTVSR